MCCAANATFAFAGVRDSSVVAHLYTVVSYFLLGFVACVCLAVVFALVVVAAYTIVAVALSATCHDYLSTALSRDARGLRFRAAHAV